jgi:RNA polymerase sigma factor (sigma-70 family)
MIERGAADDDDALVGSKTDGERFVAVFEARAGEVWRYLAARLGARGADELLSEVFVRAFANRSRFDPKRGSARAWLLGIATNVCREQLRDERRSPTVSSDTTTTGWTTDSSNRIAERRVLGAAIASLPDERQEVVVLIAAIGLS